MLKKVTNKKLFLFLTLTMLMSMFMGIGLASAAASGLYISCDPASVYADNDQPAGDISVRLGSNYADSIGEGGQVVAEITLPYGTTFSAGESVAVDGGTAAGQTPDEIRIRFSSSADNGLDISNIGLDIEPNFRGPVMAAVHVWGLDSAGVQVFSADDSIAIAEVKSPLVSAVDKSLVSTQVATVVNFPDANLETMIRTALSKPSGDITTDDMATLTYLNFESSGIANLTGMETAVNLVQFDIGVNQISSLAPLSGLTKLTGLWCNMNQITSVAPLSGLTSLQILDANRNSISDVSPLAGLTGLQQLEVAANGVTNVSSLSTLTNLTFLNLSENQISNISALSGMTKLVTLHLEINQISNISPIAGLTQLQYVWLSDNLITTLPSLAAWTQVVNLYLDGNQITNVAGLSGMSACWYIDLANNPTIDISTFTGLATLRMLDLSYDNLSSLSSLPTNIPTLKRLYLQNNNISNVSPLGSLPGLWYVDLSYNQVGDISSFLTLADLEEVYLSNNQIVDISSLASKNFLWKVDLAYNQITDISVLSNLKFPAGYGTTNVDVTYNNLDISSGSAALNTINTLIGKGATVYYYPQRVNATYTVTYNGNSSTGGTVPVDSNSYSQVDTVTVLRNTGSLVKTGYTFGGWNTAANGSGTTYAPGDTFTMGPANRILYAKWVSENVLIEDFVTRFYQLCLSREPDAGGLAYWVNALVAQQETGASIAKNFIFSVEFINRGVSDSTYLDIMYQTFFNRAADSGGKAYWQEQMNNGMSRMYILASFVNSDEFNTVCTTYGITRGSITLTDPADLHPQITAFVNRFYVECLERVGDSAGLNYWVDQLVTGARAGADVANGFIGSPEFQARGLTNEQYLTILYTAFFNRAADTAGWNYWIAQLTAGTSRMEVLGGFIYAPEFGDLCAAYGIRQM